VDLFDILSCRLFVTAVSFPPDPVACFLLPSKPFLFSPSFFVLVPQCHSPPFAFPGALSLRQLLSPFHISPAISQGVSCPAPSSSGFSFQGWLCYSGLEFSFVLGTSQLFEFPLPPRCSLLPTLPLAGATPTDIPRTNHLFFLASYVRLPS